MVVAADNPPALEASAATASSVEMVLTLPKKEFLLGEVIPATLTFTRQGDGDFRVYSGASDPVERPWGISFHGEDLAGAVVSDPFLAYRNRGRRPPGNATPLGKGSVALEVYANEWLHFDQPGTYTLWSTSERVRKGDGQNVYYDVNRVMPGVAYPVTSNRVTITIAPLLAETEKQWLDEAVRQTGNEELYYMDPVENIARHRESRMAMRRLMSLQTPAAWEALLSPNVLNLGSLVGDAALFGCPEPEKLALKLLPKAPMVSGPTVKDAEWIWVLRGLTPRTVELYALLKTARQLPLWSTPSLAEAQQEMIQVAEPHLIPAYIAEQELARQWRSGIGYETYLGRNSYVVDALATHQIELDGKRSAVLLSDSNIAFGTRFLPLIRREAGAPRFSVTAFVLLCQIAQEEARSILVADLTSGERVYEKRPEQALEPRAYPGAYLHLPEGPMPALTPVFRALLAKPSETPAQTENLARLLDRYGAADLLPDVIRLFEANRTKSEVANPCLRFWMRCDRPGALATLKVYRDAPQYNAVYCLQALAKDRWDADLQALCVQDLDRQDIRFVAAAIALLGEHGDPMFAPQTAAAFFRVLDAAETDPEVMDQIKIDWNDVPNMANNLLNSAAWKDYWSQQERDRLAALSRPIPKDKSTPSPVHHVATLTVWGEPVNGLRLGVVTPLEPILSYPLPAFDLVIENVGKESVELPERLASANVSESVSFEVSGADGKAMEKIPRSHEEPPAPKTSASAVLTPGQTKTFAATPLMERTPAGTPNPWQGCKLPPGGPYALRFSLKSAPASDKQWGGTLISGEAKVIVAPPSAAAFPVQAGFTMKQSDFFLGEPIPVTFTVRNLGDGRFTFVEGGDEDSTGRHNHFKITAVDDQGKPVPDPAPKPTEVGGFGQSVDVVSNRPWRETLLINQWCAFHRPGKYTVKLSRTLPLEDANEHEARGISDEELLAQKEVTAEFTITLREDVAAGKKLLEELTARMVAGQLTYADGVALHARGVAKDDSLLPLLTQWISQTTWPPKPEVDQEEGAKMLVDFGPETAQPIFEKSIDHANPAMRREIVQYLALWKSPRLKAVIAQLFASTDRKDTISALRACRGNPDPALRTELLKIARGNDSEFREGAAVMLADYPNDPEVLAALRLLLSDPREDHGITIEAARSLHTLGHNEGISALIDLLSIAVPGRVAAELKDITGKHLGVNQTLWREWFEAEQKKSGP